MWAINNNFDQRMKKGSINVHSRKYKYIMSLKLRFTKRNDLISYNKGELPKEWKATRVEYLLSSKGRENTDY